VLAVQDVGQAEAGSADAENLFADAPVAASEPEGATAEPQDSVRQEPEAAAASDGETSEAVENIPVLAAVEPDLGTETLPATTEPVEMAPLPESLPEVEPAPALEVETTNVATGEVESTADDTYVPRVYGRTNANSRVEIRAIDTSWVQIEAPGNQVLLTRVLLPGDVYRVPNGDQITLKTGNAGGLELRVDGTLIEPLGEPGMVIKDVLLDPEALLRE